MKQRLLFGLSVAIISVFPISAQESDSAAVRVEKEPYVMPRNSVYYELWGGSTGAGATCQQLQHFQGSLQVRFLQRTLANHLH